MKLFTFFLFMFLSAFVFEGTLPAQVDNDYWIVVPANYDTVGKNIPLLTVFAENPTNVTVKAAGATYTVNANQAGTTIPNAMPMIPQHKRVVKRAIHVYSFDGLPFHVQLAMNPEEWGEGTWCIPTHSLGKMYRIVGYRASNTNIHPTNNPAANGIVTPEFAIVATHDNTQVTIDFPPGKNLASITIIMNAGDAYHVDCGGADVKIDPTGTRVTADQPIAVFSGQANANIGGTGYGNALLEQMFPIESWGKLHNIVADPLQAGDVYRFVADCDNTQISNDGALIATIDAGKFYEVTIFGAHEICSTKPIEVAKFTKGGDTLYGGYDGGPSMLVIPPVNCYFDSSRFYQMDIPAARGGIGVPGVVIICPTAYTASVLFDGVPVAGFQAITNSCSPIQYSWAYAPISITTAGAHTLCYSTPSAANPYSLYGYYTSQDGDRDENLAWNVGYRSPKAPLALLTQENLDFGTLICDTTKTLPIKLSNVGTAPLTISSTSGLVLPFTLAGLTLPVTLQPGDSVKGAVTFTSSTPSTYMQTLAFATNEVGICGPPVDTIHIEARKERAAITSIPPSYNFGDVTCQDYETTVTVTNVGTVNVRVTDSTFSQAGLEIVSPPLPVTITPGNTQQFTIRLHSSLIPVGTYSSTLRLTAQPCDLSCDFQFTANRKALVYNVSPAVKDFGITNVNKTSNGTFTFDNQSDVAVHIAKAQFDSSSFIVTTTFGQTVAPHSSLAIDFMCYPPDTLKYESTLTINIDSPCVDGRKVLVRVEGISMCLSPLTTNTIGKRPGDEITIPILLEPSTKFVTAKEMEVTVTYDPNLLRFVMVTSSLGKVSQVSSSNGEVSFTLTLDTALPTPGATIAELHTQAFLAPYVEGKIEITQSSITLESGEKIAGRNCPSTFTLDSSCVMPHELKKRSTAEITGLYPNPSRNTVTLEVIAHNEPDVRIEVYDTFGRRVKVVHDGELGNGTHDVTINTEHYSTGIYLCRLVCNGRITTKAFTVEK